MEILRILLTEKFRYVKHLRKNPIKILDVGCGNHSPSITKRLFKNCEYHGIDKEYYNLTYEDIRLIDAFFQIDLDNDLNKLDSVPNEYYDYIIVSHTIEHLKNGLKILDYLCKKLKTGGYIYIEYPSLKSFNLPSMEGCLHFCDDPTHVRCYDPHDIINVLLDNNIKIIFARERRNKFRIILMPLIILKI